MNDKILIIDDEKEITELIEAFLKNESYQVYKAHSSNEAIKIIESESLDLAIIDIMLPDGNGFDLCKLIREKYTYPIIMLTSKTEGVDRITGLSLGADDYVTKPFLGLLLPIVQKDKSKKIILYGLITSALIEIIQYVFALGSSDIDDLTLNTLGTIIGYLLYKIIHKKAHADTLTAISIIVLVTVLGGFALGILFINHTELFMLSSKEIVVENKNLVQDFIDTQPTVSGKFVKVNGNVLTLEKSIHSSTDTRTIMDLEITPNSNIYICYNKIDYFFSTISGEQISYEKIEYSDFLSQNNNSFTKENNVRIWSSDGKTIDNLVITEWIE